MILLDTNIVSTFARVDALDLVRQLFKAEQLHITQATVGELERAIEVGRDFLKPTLAAIRCGAGFRIVELNSNETLVRETLPKSLGPGESEAIAISLCRPQTTLLTNDKRAKNFCREKQLSCFELRAILRAMWVEGVRSKDEVRKLVARLETERRFVLKDKESIFRTGDK